MKIIYFDCFSGISGDMILGALFDSGLSLDLFNKELKKLPISNYEILISKTNKNSISGTSFGYSFCVTKLSAIRTAILIESRNLPQLILR